MTKFLTLLTTCVFTSFLSFAQPVIQSFSPASGATSSPVTITGTGFSTVATDNIVYFGAAKATVVTNTATSIIATVPAGATYQPITVTTNGLTTSSALPFLVSNGGSGAGLPFNGTSFMPKQDFTTGKYPRGLALGDFNLDGKVDLLVSKGNSATFSVLTNTSSGSTVSFAPDLDFPVMGNDHEVPATGDLDGDGKLDIVVPESNSANLFLFRNITTGPAITFNQPYTLQVGSNPMSVAISDLDGDGKPEVVTTNVGFGEVSVYRNKSTPGNFSFAAPVNLGSNLGPYSIALADLDADGKAEIVLTSQFSTPSYLYVLKNNSTVGNISFQTPLQLANIAGPYTVAVGDLNGDSKPDLVAASAFSNTVVVKQNTSTPGSLAFSGTTKSYVTGSFPEGVAITDFDGDNKPDIVAANQQANTVSVLRNISSGTSILFDTHVDYAVGSAPNFVSCADLDGDGRSEIITANTSSDGVSVLKNIIGANVAPVISAFTPGAGGGGTAVTITGTNFTGVTDVKFGGVKAASFTVNSNTSITAIVGPGASGEVSVTTGMGTAVLPGFVYNGPVISSFTPTVGVTGTTVTIDGTNFTGVTEVKFGGIPAASFTVNSATTIYAVVGNGASGEVSVTTSNGTAGKAAFSFNVPTITGFTPATAPAGATVTITGINFGTTVSDNTVFFGAVKATVLTASPTQLTAIVPACATYAPITVTTNHLTASSSMPFSASFTTGNPQITTASFGSAGSYATGDMPWAVYTSDLNDDGKPEVITANVNNISILKNVSSIGNVSFENKLDWPVEKGPGSIAIGDLNGDGKPDLAVVNFNAGRASRLSVFQNTSTGGDLSFGTRNDFATGDGAADVAIADINGDRKPDVLVTSGSSGYFSIFQNTTTGNTVSFAPRQDFTNILGPDYLAVADFDKDGRVDVVTANFSNGRIFSYRNVSTGGVITLTSNPDVAVGTYAGNISTGDLDLDGKLDLFIRNANNLTFLQNTSSLGNISFANAQNFTSPIKSAIVGDLNGDGKPDLGVGQYSTGKISIYENTTTTPGNLSLAANVDLTISSNWDTYTAIDDLDGDGKPEAVAINQWNNAVTILRNNIGNPTITQFTPAAARKGEVVTITGPDLSGTTAVQFGGTTASAFTIVSPIRIDATVAGGASGNVSVTTAAGTGSLWGFSFIPEITANGTTNICNNSSVTLTSTALANNQWYKNGIIINGASGTAYQASTAGNYTVKTINAGVTTISPTGIIVNVTTVPTPTITVNGGVLLSSATTGNQWYLNGTLIPNATNKTYQPTESGNYAVRVTAGGCTSDLSVAFNYIYTATLDVGNGQTIKLWPNPVRSILTLQWDIANLQTISVQITDMYGMPVLNKQGIISGGTINIESLPTGTYFIKMVATGKKPVGTIKILKVN